MLSKAHDVAVQTNDSQLFSLQNSDLALDIKWSPNMIPNITCSCKTKVFDGIYSSTKNL